MLSLHYLKRYNQMKRTYIILLVLFAILSVQGADIPLSSRHVTTADGLSGNTINELIQDDEGYIWMATNNGLSRYDGYRSVNYTSLTPDDSNRQEAHIGRIYYDRQRSLLWMSTATYQNACYDLQRQRFVDYSGHGDIYRAQSKLMLTSRGTVLYGMKTGATLCGRTGDRYWTKAFTVAQHTLPSDNVLSVVEDAAHNIWLNTDRGVAVVPVNSNDGRTINLFGRDEQSAIVASAASSRAVYLLTRKGTVVAYDTKLKKIYERQQPAIASGLDRVNVSFVWQNKWLLFTPSGTYAVDLKTGLMERSSQWQVEDGLNQGSLPGYHFVGTRKGVLWIFPDKGEARRLDLIPPHRHVTNRGWLFHITSDKEGRLFIATYGNGLFVYSPATGDLSHYSADDAQPIIDTDYLVCAITDQQGNIWLGSETAGAYCLTIGDVETVRYLKPQPTRRGGWDNYIRRIHLGSDNIIKVHTRDGSLYDTDAGMTALSHLEDHVADSATCSIIDRQGHVWTGTFGRGVFVNGRQLLADDVNSSRINDIKMDKDGVVWLATNNGIHRWNGKKFDVYNTQNRRLSNNEIHTLCFTSKHVMWAGTAGGGLLKCELDGADSIVRTASLTIREGLPNNNVTALAYDRQGYLWIGTEDGIARMRPDSMNISGTYRFSSSLSGNNVSINSSLITADGLLLFGTADGLLVIDPSRFSRDVVGRLTITAMVVNGVTRLAEWPSELSSDENTLSFHFSCFDYGGQQSVLYQHYLEGLEEDWKDISTVGQADYVQLPPGDYILHVRTLNEQGGWNAETTLSFTILQPWYNRWWAWLIYVLIAAAIGYHLYRNWHERFRLHQQMKIERQLSQFRQELFTNITHEFRTPISIIKGAVDKLSQVGGGLQSDNRAALQSVQRGTGRLLRLVNQFMEYRKITTGNLRLQVAQGDIVAFVRNMVQDFLPMAWQKDIQLTFTPQMKSFMVPFDHQMVETIVYNLLSNAVKYTPERGGIFVRLKVEDAVLLLSVEDNGPGISPERQKELFKPFMHGYASQGGMGIGLYTARQLAEVHKGALNYEALQPGSLFTLTLPATDAVYAADEYSETTAISTTETDSREHEQQIIREMLPEAFNDLTVAIIEDNPDMMQQICTEVGVYFHTVGYSTGQAAIDGITAEPPSLVLCDVMLPDTDGYQIVKQLKENERTAVLPIIMLTALADENHQIKAYKVGVDDYMVKPCNFRLLIARMMQLIKWNRAATAVPAVDDKTPELVEHHVDKVFKEKLEVFTARHLSDSDFSVDRLAEMMSMGRTKFYGKVKELTGMSPNKYLQEARMQRAAELLLEGELNVSEISYKVGIQDPSYFNKVFKARFGVVPSKYGR